MKIDIKKIAHVVSHGAEDSCHKHENEIDQETYIKRGIMHDLIRAIKDEDLDLMSAALEAFSELQENKFSSDY